MSEYHSVPGSKGANANVEPAGKNPTNATTEGVPGKVTPPQGAGNVNPTNDQGYRAPSATLPALAGPSLTAPKPAPNVKDCSS